MQAGLVLVSLGAVIAALQAGGTVMAALDNEQFCKAMLEISRLGNADAGTWIDRNTRDDGIKVICAIRTVNYKRFVRANSAQGADWRSRKQREWNSIACSSLVLREAIDNGWIITTTLTLASGERDLLIATCN